MKAIMVINTIIPKSHHSKPMPHGTKFSLDTCYQGTPSPCHPLEFHRNDCRNLKGCRASLAISGKCRKNAFLTCSQFKKVLKGSDKKSETKKHYISQFGYCRSCHCFTLIQNHVSSKFVHSGTLTSYTPRIPMPCI